MTDALFLLDPDHDDMPLDARHLGAGWRLTLPQSVRRHAVQAMRLTDGDPLQLSDGRGLRIHAVLTDAGQGVAEVREFTTEPRPVTTLTLIQALAKGGHDEQAIDAATQIGVDRVVPWQADRSIAKFKAGRTDRKWRQVLEAATEQSRRSRVPELAPCVASSGVVAEIRRANVHGGLVIVLHQDATDTWGSIEALVDQLASRSLEDGKPRDIAVVVGPEGGIGEDEAAAFREAGAHVCVVGRNILRASVAGPVALSLLGRALGRYA